MPYDICEDEEALDYIENEMARRGVTQELIDETRASTEMRMLRDLQIAAMQGQNLECVDEQNATPVSTRPSIVSRLIHRDVLIFIFFVSCTLLPLMDI